MKPIELTEEHKSKMLEMCKKLFLQYEHYRFLYKNYVNMYNLDEIGEEIEKTSVSVHWLEFCITDLSYMICMKSQAPVDVFMREIIGVIYFYKNTGNRHLVDYLYEKFNQLKLN